MSSQRTSNLKKIGRNEGSRTTSPCPSECSEASSFALSDFDTRRTQGKPLRIAIEGNIAAGKSTFLKILEDLQDEHHDYHWYVQPEPLSKWTKKENLEHKEVENIATDKSENSTKTSSPSETPTPKAAKPSAGGDEKSDINLLDAFYTNPKRWAYTFEAYTFITRMHQARQAELEVQEDLKKVDAQPNAITFFERSVYSSRLVFAENSFETGLMSSTEWAIYCDWTNFVLKTVKELKLDGIVYLQCDPNICHKRMQIRQRSEEGGVPLDYLLQLHEKYERWIGPDGWMKVKDEADTCPKTPPKNKARNSLNGLEISKTTGIHSVVERTLADVPVLVLNCTQEFKTNMENRNQMISCVRDWLARRVVVDHEDLDDADQPLKDLTNEKRAIFKSPNASKKRPHESFTPVESDEENETPRSSLPKAFKKEGGRTES